MAYVLGNSCDYYTIPKFLLVLLIIYAISFSFFPESPTVLVKQNRIAVNIFKEKVRKKANHMQRAVMSSFLFHGITWHEIVSCFSCHLMDILFAYFCELLVSGAPFFVPEIRINVNYWENFIRNTKLSSILVE